MYQFFLNVDKILNKFKPYNFLQFPYKNEHVGKLYWPVTLLILILRNPFQIHQKAACLGYSVVFESVSEDQYEESYVILYLM